MVSSICLSCSSCTATLCKSSTVRLKSKLFSDQFSMTPTIASSFCCVRCGATSLIKQLQSFECTSCGTDYPIVHDVPIFFPDVVIESVDPDSETGELAISICDYQGLPKDPKTLKTVQQIFLKNYRFADLLLDAESQQYVDRVKATRIRDQLPAQVGESQLDHDRSIDHGRNHSLTG